MKLQSSEDKLNFLSEVGRIDLIDQDPEDYTTDLFEEFIKRRKHVVPRLKNFRRAQIAKSDWRKYRWRYMKGINKFHRSLRGKRLHRSMGRFLATRYFLNPPKKKKGKSEALILSRDLALKAISSMRTHMYIEQGYYMPLSEQVEFEMFTDYALPILRTIESELYEDIQYEFDKDELELLLRLVEAGEMHKSIAEVLDIEVKEVEGSWVQHEGEEENTYFLTERFEHMKQELLEVEDGK